MFILEIIILIYSVILHEISHGFVAQYFGDNTAKNAGRFTLNPIPHIDPVLTIVVPLIFIALGSPIVFGGAKPVPVNPANFKNYKVGLAATAAAGPITNILIALLFAIIFRLVPVNQAEYQIIAYGVIINIFLAIFNLIPIPPLDGFKIIGGILPGTLSRQWYSLERYSVIFFILLIISLGYLINSVVYPLSTAIINILLS